MREFTQRLAGEDLTRGLQPKDLGFGSLHASELLNLRPEDEGLRGYEFLDDPFNGGISSSFPFPQLFETPYNLLLFQESQVQEITESTDPWGVSSVSTYDPANPNNTKSITSGGSWHMANMQRSWYATNGESVVFRTGLDQLDDGSGAKTFVGDEISINTLTYHKGRVFMAGFDTDLWESTFESFFADWQNQLSNLNLTPPYDEVGRNWIAYSSIGGGDLPLWLFHPQGYNTDLAPTKDRVLDRFRRNEIGFLPLPTKSEVKALKPLGDNLVAYCSEGIFLIQLEFPRTDEVPAIVGQRKLMNPGVLNRGAVGGNELQQVFIDQLGRLWSVGPEGETQELGYQNQFEDFLSEDTIIEYERSGGDFYISFGSKAFLLTDQGLCEIGESPTFVINRGTQTHGISKSHSKPNALYKGPPIDFGDRGLKTVTSLAAAYSGGARIECAFDYRFEPHEAWKRTAFEEVNPRGLAYIRQAGGAFRPIVRINDPSRARLDYIEIRFQLDDKRHQRGPRAGEIDS